MESPRPSTSAAALAALSRNNVNNPLPPQPITALAVPPIRALPVPVPQTFLDLNVLLFGANEVLPQWTNEDERNAAIYNYSVRLARYFNFVGIRDNGPGVNALLKFIEWIDGDHVTQREKNREQRQAQIQLILQQEQERREREKKDEKPYHAERTKPRGEAERERERQQQQQQQQLPPRQRRPLQFQDPREQQQQQQGQGLQQQGRGKGQGQGQGQRPQQQYYPQHQVVRPIFYPVFYQQQLYQQHFYQQQLFFQQLQLQQQLFQQLQMPQQQQPMSMMQQQSSDGPSFSAASALFPTPAGVRLNPDAVPFTPRTVSNANLAGNNNNNNNNQQDDDSDGSNKED